jgi:hypothetical protein
VSAKVLSPLILGKVMKEKEIVAGAIAILSLGFNLGLMGVPQILMLLMVGIMFIGWSYWV